MDQHNTGIAPKMPHFSPEAAKKFSRFSPRNTAGNNVSLTPRGPVNDIYIYGTADDATGHSVHGVRADGSTSSIEKLFPFFHQPATTIVTLGGGPTDSRVEVRNQPPANVFLV